MSLRGLAIRIAKTLAVSALACAATDRRRQLGHFARDLRRLAGRPADRRRPCHRRHHALKLFGRLSRAHVGARSLVSNARGASSGKGAIVGGHIEPATFATTASSSKMTRTIRMALADNAVTGVEIAPPFDENPDRIPADRQGQARDRRSRRRLRDPRAGLGADSPRHAIAPSRSSTAGRASTSSFPMSASEMSRPKAIPAPSRSARRAMSRSPAIGRTGPRRSSWPKTRTSRSGSPRSTAPTCCCRSAFPCERWSARRWPRRPNSASPPNSEASSPRPAAGGNGSTRYALLHERLGFGRARAPANGALRRLAPHAWPARPRGI